jgi:hypothetical protein
MFTQKILDINNIIISKICEHYDLNKEDVYSFLEKEMQMNFTLIGEDIEQIKVIKKHKKKENAKDASTTSSIYCDARVYTANELVVKQCSRCKLEGSSFCKIHDKLNQNGKLKYGTIHETKPDCISTERLNMKVKRTIY